MVSQEKDRYNEKKTNRNSLLNHYDWRIRRN